MNPDGKRPDRSSSLGDAFARGTLILPGKYLQVTLLAQNSDFIPTIIKYRT
jgi:hypothetical protein